MGNFRSEWISSLHGGSYRRKHTYNCFIHVLFSAHRSLGIQIYYYRMCKLQEMRRSSDWCMLERFPAAGKKEQHHSFPMLSRGRTAAWIIKAFCCGCLKLRRIPLLTACFLLLDSLAELYTVQMQIQRLGQWAGPQSSPTWVCKAVDPPPHKHRHTHTTETKPQAQREKNKNKFAHFAALYVTTLIYKATYLFKIRPGCTCVLL